MNEPEPLEAPEATGPAPPQARAFERYPFWGYSDVLVFAALALPSLFAGVLLVRGGLAVLPLKLPGRIPEMLGQFAGYGILFGMLVVLFRVQYNRPFWKSLRWVDAGMRPARIVLGGVLLAVGIGAASVLLRTPDVNTPMKQLLSDRTTAIVLAAFGTTLGPLCEELAFRGFLQPLLTRSFGVVPGIVLAALPFGVLHLQQYGFVWQSGVLVTLTGVAFGWIRHQTGSTKAAAIMHAAYNSTLFVGLMVQLRNLPAH